ncbi:MAG: hypothetical protein HY998_04465 [candidate division NC10 bacterium]|nr:hypothetical protein [candidate division NC10 bacterium]
MREAKRVCWITLTLLFVLLCEAYAGGSTNVPLHNWTYFANQWDWSYEAIKKIASAGLVEGAVLNTKPMSRMEMARIVARAMDRFQGDVTWAYKDQKDLEATVRDLIEEFEPELASLGVEPVLKKVKPPPFFFLKPVDKIEARFGYSEGDFRRENSQGELLREGLNSRFAFSSRAQLGDFLSLYGHPEFLLNEEESKGRLVEGYLKLTYYNVELEVGRESVWWGPGFHGAMLFSNNAEPLDLVKLSSAEPFPLPWFLKSLGPVKLTFFLARLEKDRDFPRAKLAAWRINFTPSPLIEVGVARVVQFGGKGRPTVKWQDIPKILVESNDKPESKFNTNQIYSIDATLRLRDIGRYVPIARDLEVYGELGVDDTCCEDVFWPLKPAFLVGMYTPNLFQRPNMDFRVEYTLTTSNSFTHGIYSTGYSYKGNPIAHFIGTKGDDLYMRFTRRLDNNWLLGLEADNATVGSTQVGQAFGTKEKRKFAGIDISYRYSKPWSFFAAYRLQRTENIGFVSGKDDTNNVLTLGVTHSFR